MTFSAAPPSVPLADGDELRCPHCRAWHPLTTRHQDGTPYACAMLYWECRGRSFYAGQVGSVSRHQTRRQDDTPPPSTANLTSTRPGPRRRQH